jgi:hypothetical protein
MSSAAHLWDVRQLLDEGFGRWSFAPGIDDGARTDLMPAGYRAAPGSTNKKLLNFVTMADVHITDKETPSQPLFLARLYENKSTAVYSPVMMYSTQVLDAAIQTVNAVHRKEPIDFLISLGEVTNYGQYNELRWYLDVFDGKVITPSSGRMPVPVSSIIKNIFRQRDLIRPFPGTRRWATMIIFTSGQFLWMTDYGRPLSVTPSSR